MYSDLPHVYKVYIYAKRKAFCCTCLPSRISSWQSAKQVNLFVLHPTVIHSSGLSDTINKQADKDNTQRLEMRMQGRRGWDKMEECLGVNGRRLFVRVDCNLEE